MARVEAAGGGVVSLPFASTAGFPIPMKLIADRLDRISASLTIAMTSKAGR